VLEELTDRYGDPPEQVTMLIAVSRLRRAAQKAGLSEVVAMGNNLRVAPAVLADSIQVRLQRMYPGARVFAQTNSMTVPMPRDPADAELLEWVSGLLAAIFPPPVAVEPTESVDAAAESSG
jgi:transcription-repair coupling factor (superfamily II helicase)